MDKVKLLQDIFKNHDIPKDTSCLDKVLTTLTPREEWVLRQRYSGKTLEEIGKLLPNPFPALYGHTHLSKERIRQIESKALRKLRHPTRSKIIKEEYHGM